MGFRYLKGIAQEMPWHHHPCFVWLDITWGAATFPTESNFKIIQNRKTNKLEFQNDTLLPKWSPIFFSNTKCFRWSLPELFFVFCFLEGYVKIHYFLALLWNRDSDCQATVTSNVLQWWASISQTRPTEIGSVLFLKVFFWWLWFVRERSFQTEAGAGQSQAGSCGRYWKDDRQQWAHGFSLSSLTIGSLVRTAVKIQLLALYVHPVLFF